MSEVLNTEIVDLTEEYKKYILDPNLTQFKTIEYLTKSLNNELNLPDPNNPFFFLLENQAKLTSAALMEIENRIRKMYPVLASNKEELYPHISPDEIIDIFATPSKTIFNFFISLNDILKYGYKINNVTEVTLPNGTYIEVNNIKFTLLNDIIIRVYDSGKIVVLQKGNRDLDIAYQSDLILPNAIQKDAEGLTWLAFSTEVKQVKVTEIEDYMLASKPYNKDFIIDDKYYFLESYGYYNNNKVKFNITFSDFTYDINTPTLIVKPDKNKINVRLPSYYLLDNKLGNKLIHKLYTTEGNIEISFSKLNSNMFRIVKNITSDPRTQNLNLINIHVNSTIFTYGGRDEISFEELKNKIVNKATGDNELPITINELKDEIETYGLIMVGVNNLLINKEILVTKRYNNLGYNNFTNIETYNLKLTLNTLDNINNNKISFTNNSIVIEPLVLMEKKDKSLLPLSGIETESVENLVKSSLQDYNNRELYTNLYRYILDLNQYPTLRIYDVLNVILVNNSIEYLSPYSPVIINIIDRVFTKTNKGFNFRFYLEPNEDSYNLVDDNTYAKLVISGLNGETLELEGIFRTTPDKVYIEFHVDCDNYIDKNNYLKIFRGENFIYITDVSDVNLYIYSKDTNLTPDLSFASEISDSELNTMFYKEKMKIKFFTFLKKLYDSFKINFTDRKFKTYETDVYLTYKEDIYELDEYGLPKFELLDTDGDGEPDDVKYKIIHKAGEVVLDDNGNPVLLHKKGDLVLDEEGNPVIDYEKGVLYTINMLGIEDKLRRVTEKTFIEYRENVFQDLYNTLTKTLPKLSKKLLENNDIKFIGETGIDNVRLKLNNKIIEVPRKISPVVNIFIPDGVSYEISNEIKLKVYEALNSYIKTNISINKLELIIKELIDDGNVLSVKLENILPNDIYVINYDQDSGNRLVIKKKLIKDDSGNLVLDHDVSFKIVTV